MAARVKIKSWPLALTFAFLLASVVLAIVVWQAMSTDAVLPYAIAGYVLTPFAATLGLILARRMDLSYQGNPLYLRLDGQQKIKLIGLLVALSFIPATIHIWYIAGYVGSVLS